MNQILSTCVLVLYAWNYQLQVMIARDMKIGSQLLNG